MAGRKNKVDTESMTAEELSTYNERLAKQREPKPAYMCYRVGSDGETVEPLQVSRSAEETLKYVDQNPGVKYMRFEIK